MLTLLNPSALLALLGLVVPLAIYLWNRRPGPEVAVGSLRWLAAGANRRLRNLKPEQLGLLLLRAALLAALAVAVAGPAWRQVRPAGRGQVLLGPTLAGSAELTAVRPLLDSLRRQGYALRWLAPGLPAVPADSLGHYRGPVGAGFYWARVQQAVDSFPGQPLHVVAPGRLRDWAGPHPPLPAAVQWHLLPTAHTATWLESAAAGRADSLHLLLGQSTATQTTFRPVAVARPAAGAGLRVPGLAPLHYQTTGGGQLQADSANAKAVALPLHLVVYATAAHAEEARYLRAALQAATLGLPMPVSLTATTTVPAPATQADWLFWLADAPVPAPWQQRARRGVRVWQAAPGPGTADTAQLVAPATEATPVALFRRAKLAAGGGRAVLWADGRGRPVLTRQAVGQGAFYQLATRLQPAWSTLADSPALPALLLAVLRPEPALDALAPPDDHDQRHFDVAQLPPATAPAHTQPLPATAFTFSDLRPWLVLMALLLFTLERWLARRAATLAPHA